MRQLAANLVVGESPRWHEGRLWFAHWGEGAQELVAMGDDGALESIQPGPKPAGFCIDWLSDGRLLVAGEDGVQCGRREYVGLAGLGVGWNEIVVDARDNLNENGDDNRFGSEEFRPGTIVFAPLDGPPRRVADDLMFPTGIVITPDGGTLVVAESWANRLTAFDIAEDGGLSGRRVWAPVGGDGICMDAEGAIWCASMTGDVTTCVRVGEGGEILERFELDEACFACALGGPAGRTLYLMLARWRGVEHMAQMFRSRTGRIVATEVAVPRLIS